MGRSGSSTPSTKATPRGEMENSIGVISSVTSFSLGEHALDKTENPEDENRALKEQNAALMRQINEINEKAALLQQRALLEEENKRLQMMRSFAAMPNQLL